MLWNVRCGPASGFARAAAGNSAQRWTFTQTRRRRDKSHHAQACGGCFPDWERYYGHVIAPDNRVCAWVQIDLIDVVPKKKGDGEGDAPAGAGADS